MGFRRVSFYPLFLAFTHRYYIQGAEPVNGCPVIEVSSGQYREPTPKNNISRDSPKKYGPANGALVSCTNAPQIQRRKGPAQRAEGVASGERVVTPMASAEGPEEMYLISFSEIMVERRRIKTRRKVWKKVRRNAAQTTAVKHKTAPVSVFNYSEESNVNLFR
ncbi:hypothetical protein HZH66_002239 [Vespula vulgaris]|uniref:Uncharacterized protein n=2 Tax=Vespula TaxID=7451 RepID=A0A834NFS5_VESVU|nr:hypothetical protein HZH66_002239 [Vespula vulgaris]